MQHDSCGHTYAAIGYAVYNLQTWKGGGGRLYNNTEISAKTIMWYIDVSKIDSFNSKVVSVLVGLVSLFSYLQALCVVLCVLQCFEKWYLTYKLKL
jgi:hypothetical protein